MSARASVSVAERLKAVDDAERRLRKCSENWLERRPLGINPALDEELSQATLDLRRASRKLAETRKRLGL